MPVKLLNTKKRRQVSMVLSLALLAFILLSGLIIPEANAVHQGERLAVPSLWHPFGTDQFGRDVLARTVHGFRYTFVLSLLVQAVSFPGGVALGVLVGYYGGLLDEIFYQLANVALSFPLIVAAILLASLTESNIWVLLALLMAYGVITNAKIVRSEVLVIKNADYIKTLRVLGASDYWIMKKHLARKSLRMLLPSLALLVGHVILAISTYSFMGFGVQPPQPEIGAMLKDSVRFLGTAPWLMFLPGLFQFLMILMILNLSGNANRLMFGRKERYV